MTATNRNIPQFAVSHCLAALVSRCRAPYFSLLVQRKVGKRKHTLALRPPLRGGFPAVLDPEGAAETRGAAHRSDTRPLFSLRICAPRRNAKGPNIKSNSKAARDAVLRLFAFDVGPLRAAPSSAARAGGEPGICGCPVDIRPGERPAPWAGPDGAPGRHAKSPTGHGWPVGDGPEHVSSAGSARDSERCGPQGVLSLGYFSLHKQREVPRRRRNQRQDREPKRHCARTQSSRRAAP